MVVGLRRHPQQGIDSYVEGRNRGTSAARRGRYKMGMHFGHGMGQGTNMWVINLISLILEFGPIFVPLDIRCNEDRVEVLLGDMENAHARTSSEDKKNSKWI